MTMRAPATASADHDFELVIVVADMSCAHGAVVNLANDHYPRKRAIFVCATKAIMDYLTEALYGIRNRMPRYAVFRSKKDELSVLEMMQAGLQSVTAPYYGVILAGDMSHHQLLYRLSATLATTDADCLTVDRCKMNGNGWLIDDDLPYDRFMLLKTEAAKDAGGYQSDLAHPYEAEWRLHQIMTRNHKAVHVPELLYCRLIGDDDESAKERFVAFQRSTALPVPRKR